MTESPAGDLAPGRPAGEGSEPSHPALLLVLSGPSGVGKDAVLDELARRGRHFHRVITCTTRVPRASERDGVDYYFVSDGEFDRLIEEGGLLEHAEVYGRRYGVPREEVQRYLRSGNDVAVRTDVQGAASIARLMPEAVRIFLAPPSIEELEQRLRSRGLDDEERIRDRLAAARGEMARENEFEYVVVNAPGRLDATADEIERILDGERTRVHGR